jgi:LysR family transcriptional regulator for metE and metH
VSVCLLTVSSELSRYRLFSIDSGEALRAALLAWLADEYADRIPVVAVKLGRNGIAKQILLARARRTLQSTI